MGEAESIVELMEVSSGDRDLDWLRQSLDAAIKLKLSALPPYLCGYWSIQGFNRDPAPPVAKIIKSILQEEMLHMGLACNMLTSIGGTPDIRTSIPTYPGSLPGGVRPQLTVYLSGLTREFIKEVCMGIEQPEEGPDAGPESNHSIGSFYSAIRDAFDTLQPEMTGENQMTLDIGSKSLYAISTPADAEKAISQISEQGEGIPTSPGPPDSAGELPHYYRFAEIYHGKSLVEVDGKWEYDGTPVPFPDVYPMARVPEDGWPNPSIGVKMLLSSFSNLLWNVLSNLQSAWMENKQDDLWEAVKNMSDLKIPAQQLMRIPLPAGGGNYGPDFRFDS